MTQDHKGVPEPKQTSNIERWGWYSIGINVILATINLVIARASSSLAVEAEMIHNIVDFMTAVGVLIGLKLATRKSKAFPYGLYKLENVISVTLGMMTFVTAYEIASDALFAPATPASVDGWMLAGIAIATAIPLIFSHYELRAGQSANSPALIADAKEYRAHVFTTGVVFAALLGQWLGFPLDRIAALVIVLAIGKTGWELLSEGMRVLLDASLSAETLLDIRQVIQQEPAVQDIKWVTGRNAGRFRFVEAEVTLRVQSLARAETVTKRIESEIHRVCPFVDRVLIHAEPVARTHARYAIPLSDTEGTMSEHLSKAPYFALIDLRLSNDEIAERRILDRPPTKGEKGIGIQIAEWLVEQNVDAVLVQDDMQGKGPLYVLRDAGVTLSQIDPHIATRTLDDIIHWSREQTH